MTSSSGFTSSELVCDEAGEVCFIKKVRGRCYRWIHKRRSQISSAILFVLFVGYAVYYVEAMIYSVEGATALTVFTAIGLLVTVKKRLQLYCHEKKIDVVVEKLLAPFKESVNNNRRLLKWSSLVLLLIGSVVYSTLVVFKSNPFRQLRATMGASVLVMTSLITSKDSNAVQWNAVVKLLVVQAVFMILLTRTTIGYDVFEFVTTELLKLTLYCISGARGAYGLLFDHSLFFIVTAVQTFLAILTALIYTLLRSVGVGRSLKKWLRTATDAQIHVLVASLHSLVTALAVSPLVFLAGVSQKHLMTAMYTCPPAAMAMALVNFPNSRTSNLTTVQIELSKKETSVHSNVYLRFARAARNGYLNALLSLALVIAYVSLYQFADVTTTWLGSRIGLEITINSVLGYLFTPVAYLVGIDWNECYAFGCLQAEKVFGFTTQALMLVPKLQSANTISFYTASIATISLCGFGTWTTFSQMTATFLVVAPRRLRRYLNIWLRLAWNTHAACLYSASIAAIIGPDSFYTQDEKNWRA